MKIKNLPGTFYARNGRWSWKVKLPGQTEFQTIPLKPSSEMPAVKDIATAEILARQIYEKSVCQANNPGDVQTLTGLFAAHTKYCELHYENSDERDYYGTSKKYLLEFVDCQLDSADFTPKMLRDFQYYLAGKALSVTTINHHASNIRRVFKWAVPEGLVPAGLIAGLNAVTGIKKGRTKAKAPKVIGAVSDIYVERTLLYMPEVVADMVRLHRITGMRSAELCGMKPIDIDTSGGIWLYKTKHKSQHITNRKKVIPLGKQSQEIIRKYMNRKLDDYLFKPEDAELQRRASRHENRNTPMSCGNRPGSNCKGTREFVGHYDKDSYRKAIIYAIKAANKANQVPEGQPLYVADWRPHQLRHSAGTEITKVMGLEAAAGMLGHSDIKVTQKFYAPLGLAHAMDVARKMG